MKFQSCLRTIAVLGLILVSFEVSAHERREHPRREEVNARVRNERKRIDEGVKNGSISPDQAKQLRGELAGVKAQEHAEVKANGGYLTKPEQKQLNQELNRDSKQIFTDKHPRRAEVNGRVRNEDRRINQGVKDGTISPDEAKTLRGEVSGVKAQERAEVQANGGYLTKTEKKQLNQELNQTSQDIHTDRTN